MGYVQKTGNIRANFKHFSKKKTKYKENNILKNGNALSPTQAPSREALNGVK